MVKETAREKMLRKQKELDKKDLSAYEMYSERRSPLRKLKNAVKGEDDFGTELSAGAAYAREKEAQRAFDEDVPRPMAGEVSLGKYPSVMKAGREAAAEERREASRMGMKKGGMVKKSKPKATKSRGDGCCVKGKTKGRMV